jgi:hypothetical protein
MSTSKDIQLLSEIKILMRERRYDDALELLDDLSKRNQISPYLLLMKARLIQLSEIDREGGLEEAEKHLLQAHEINCEDLEVIEDLAHFYDVVMPNRDLAKSFSEMYLSRTAKTGREIQEILAEF